MTSASELFCNRRSRFGRHVEADADAEEEVLGSRLSNRRNRHSSNHRRRYSPRPEENEIAWPDQTSISLSSYSGNSSAQDRLTSSTNGTRLPGAVLLARERLVERLRGASLSGTSNHASPNINRNDHVVEDNLRFADAGDWVNELTRDWGSHTNHFLEQQRSKRTPGLTTSALSSLLVEEFNLLDKYDEDTTKAFLECSICLESFKDRDKLIRLPCGHRFHYSCLVPWVRICGCCPYCRNDIVT